MKWVAFFSQTGSEIVNISKAINKWPDVIVTNKQTAEGVNKDLLSIVETTINRYITLPKRPTETDYLKVADILGYSILDEKWQDEVLITLHGYLRILPPDFTKSSTIYNGHPGLITKHPNLKGMDDGVNRIQPSLGLMLIASVLLKAGHEVKILDTALEGWNNKRLIDPIKRKLAIGLSDEEIAKAISNFSPDIVAITVLFSNFLNAAHNVATH